MSCNNVNTEPTIIGGTTGASAAYDAFGRQRISSPLLYLIHLTDMQTMIYFQKTQLDLDLQPLMRMVVS